MEIQTFVTAHNDCLSRGRNRVSHNRSKYISADLQNINIIISRSETDFIMRRLRNYCNNYYNLED